MNHWKQTQHSPNSVYLVSSKRKAHEWFPQEIEVIVSHHANRQWSRRHRNHVIEWSTDNKHFYHTTWFEWFPQIHEYATSSLIELTKFFFQTIDCKFSDPGIAILSEALKMNTTLVELYLQSEQMNIPIKTICYLSLGFTFNYQASILARQDPLHCAVH